MLNYEKCNNNNHRNANKNHQVAYFTRFACCRILNLFITMNHFKSTQHNLYT